MSERSLSSLLDDYADLVAGLPVPRLPAPANPIDAQVVDAQKRVLALGARVTDRLLPGATPEEIDEAEMRLGYPLTAGVREWFSWRHGHMGGVFDEDDPVANLLPFGR